MTQDPQTSFEEEVLEDHGDHIMNLVMGWDNAIQAYKAVDAGKLQKARDDCKKAVMEAIPLDGKEHRYRIGPYVINVKSPGVDKEIGFTRHGNHQIQLTSDHGG